MSLAREMKDDIKRRKLELAQSKPDPDDFFGQSIASEIKLLDEASKILAKHEIRGVLFKYQTAQLNSNLYTLQINSHLYTL